MRQKLSPMGGRGAIAVAGLSLLLSACWVTGPSSVTAFGPRPAGGHDVDFVSNAFYDGSSPGSQSAFLLRFESAEDAAPGYRVDYKDPTRLGNPPPGSPAIVLRVEFFDTSWDSCRPPWDVGAFDPNDVQVSGVTSYLCTDTGDGRLLIDIGMVRKLPYKVQRCVNGGPGRDQPNFTILLQSAPQMPSDFGAACGTPV